MVWCAELSHDLDDRTVEQRNTMGLQRKAEQMSECSQCWRGVSKEDTIPAPYATGRYTGKLLVCLGN